MTPQSGQEPLYSVYFAPRGYVRMVQMGREISQRHLSAFDKLIGVIGDAGSGKSLLIRGMFPGLELTNDDNGVNVRPLPLLDIDDTGFYQAHTYHMDVRFEGAFTPLPELAQAVLSALDKGKRVVIEHFELLYSLLGLNAALLIGIGDEIIVSRPTIFGPVPDDIARTVFASIKYRRMAHTAEDLTEHALADLGIRKYTHGDVRRGFMLRFANSVDLDVARLQESVRGLIRQDLPIAFVDQEHIRIGDMLHRCTGPRMHVPSTGRVENFRFLPEIHYDALSGDYLLVGLVGSAPEGSVRDLNQIMVG
ncbi:MAG TPA: alanine-tRNA synthetase second additional domain-containing protein [Candidatus Limnocylindria bacterium]|nr:alanine-tRNA synthetase second additional domain-containing protein [Candidatus Limnocylindria bacterium]